MNVTRFTDVVVRAHLGRAVVHHQLLREGRRRWGVGAVNTSFNIHGEPLVCSPDEAVDVCRRSGADALAMGPFLVHQVDG